MRRIVAYLRISRILVMLFFGTPLVILSSYLPIKRHDQPLAVALAMWMCQRFLEILKVEVECRELDRLKAHNGFIFPNHDSYLDIIAPFSLFPVRFLASAEIGSYPFIGRIAKSIGTVFVNREDKNSRQQARDSLASIDTYPPVVLFPEGGIDSVESVQPFRYGGFELVVEKKIAYIPMVILYDDFEVGSWHATESIGAAIMRLAMAKNGTNIRLVALRTVHPRDDDDAKELALAAQGTISAALKALGGEEYRIIREGL